MIILFIYLFIINIQIRLSPFSHHHFPPPQPPPLPTLNPTPICLCLWVLYTCSLRTLSLLSHIILNIIEMFLIFQMNFPNTESHYIIIIIIIILCWSSQAHSKWQLHTSNYLDRKSWEHGSYLLFPVIHLKK